MPVVLEFEDNSQRRIFASPNDKGELVIQLDRLLDDPDPQTFEALVGFLKDGGENHKSVIIERLKTRRENLPVQKPNHPLQAMLDELAHHHFPELPYIEVVWGKIGKKGAQKTIRLASFWPSKKEVRVHPYVMDDRVPKVYLQFLLYHELCHAYLMLSGQAKDGEHHGPDFYALEDQMKDVEQARTWEKTELQAYLAKVQQEHLD
jgi:predicted SprT family Zn-dependent metalloprotease